MFVCLLSANKVFVVVVVVCLLFVLLMLFNINFHWCNLLIHVVSMIVVRSETFGRYSANKQPIVQAHPRT